MSIWFLAFIQFAFGNLASGLLVLYSVSGTLLGNWLFYLILGALLIGNEIFRDRYRIVSFNVSIFYLLLLLYLSIAIPVLLDRIGTGPLFLAGIGSLIVIGLILILLRILSPRVFRESDRWLAFSITTTLVVFNLLYFFNFIPPVPLALRDIGIYHSVVKNKDGNYEVTYEKKNWYEIFRRFDSTFHFKAGDNAYCFSSVFAPSGLSTPIYHRWQYYDETLKKWLSIYRLPFPIVGGRDEGFRGYTIQFLSEGKWRCIVETERGTLLGRRTFEAKAVSEMPQLVEDVR